MVRRTEEWRRERGQHFLEGDSSVVRRMVQTAALRPGEQVLDVGAGEGAFVDLVAPAVGAAGRVTAIELDPGLAKRLAARVAANTHVVQGDALVAPLPDRIDAVVANPPFRILVPMLGRLLDHGFGRAVLVLPRELAGRLTAQPGGEEYGKLTVQMAVRCVTQVLFRVPRQAFDPPPAVASCVARITPRAVDSLDVALLDRVLDAVWEQRRRTNRHAFAPLAQDLGLPPMRITQALRDLGLQGKAPLETSPDEYAAFVRNLTG